VTLAGCDEQTDRAPPAVGTQVELGGEATTAAA
jgi:hypothetical protein